MTGPAADGDDRALYVHPMTLGRLLTQERIQVTDIDRQAAYSFIGNDPTYPGRVVRMSKEVIHNSVHARRWQAADQRYIFEYVGDV